VVTVLDKQKFTALYKKYKNVVRRVCSGRGLTPAEVEEVSQEVWTELWKGRESWPDPEPTNPGAYVAQCAHRKMKMHFRAAHTLKRAGFHVPLDEDRSSTANLKLSRAPEAEQLVEQTSIGTLLRRLAEKVGGEKRQILLDQLDQSRPERTLAEEPSAVRRGFHRMIASCRKQLGIPVRDPKAAAVTDPVKHLADRVHGFSSLEPEPSDAE
jgi:DNA-directed RNA polymerase specialized sigma24 family protein